MDRKQFSHQKNEALEIIIRRATFLLTAFVLFCTVALSAPDNAVAEADEVKPLDADWTIGDVVTFGCYPQTAKGNDNTPIEWLVLAREGHSALLLSRYGLDIQPFHRKKMSRVLWEKCSLRNWLNSELWKFAAASEQIRIGFASLSM